MTIVILPHFAQDLAAGYGPTDDTEAGEADADSSIPPDLHNLRGPRQEFNRPRRAHTRPQTPGARRWIPKDTDENEID